MSIDVREPLLLLDDLDPSVGNDLLSSQLEYTSFIMEMGEIFNVLYWKSFDESTDLALNFIDWSKFHSLIMMSLSLSTISRTSLPFFFNSILKLIAFNVNMYTPASVGIWLWGTVKATALGQYCANCLTSFKKGFT